MPNLLDEDWDIEKPDPEIKEKKKKRKRSEGNEKNVTSVNDTDSHLTEEDLKELERIQTMKEDVSSGRKKTVGKTGIGMVVITVLCAYLIILIYGTVSTQFEYQNSGLIEPVVLSVGELQTRSEFNEVLTLYRRERAVYEKILNLDYRLSKGVEEPAILAPKYEETIDDVDSVMSQIEASDVGSGYNQLLTLMDNVVKYDMYNYCSYVSEAITNNDENAEKEALGAKESIESNFQSVTNNIVTLGENVKGIDLSDVRDWSPSNYIATITGISNEKGLERENG